MKKNQIQITLPMSVSVNVAYGNKARGRYRTEAYLQWLIACANTDQYSYAYEFVDKGLHIDYKFYSKWLNKDDSIKKKDVANFIKVVDDYLPEIIDGFDDKYIWSFNTEKIHSDREEVELVISECEIVRLDK